MIFMILVFILRNKFNLANKMIDLFRKKLAEDGGDVDLKISCEYGADGGGD